VVIERDFTSYQEDGSLESYLETDIGPDNEPKGYTFTWYYPGGETIEFKETYLYQDGDIDNPIQVELRLYREDSSLSRKKDAYFNDDGSVKGYKDLLYYDDGETKEIEEDYLYQQVGLDEFEETELEYKAYRPDGTLELHRKTELNSDESAKGYKEISYYSDGETKELEENYLFKTNSDGSIVPVRNGARVEYYDDGKKKLEETYVAKQNGDGTWVSLKEISKLFNADSALQQAWEYSYNEDLSPSSLFYYEYYSDGESIKLETKRGYRNDDYFTDYRDHYYESGSKHLHTDNDVKGLDHGEQPHWREDGSIYKINYWDHGILTRVSWHNLDGSLQKVCNHLVSPIKCT